MKQFHFTKTYFNKLIFNDEESKIRIVIKETPSLEITEEDYSLRIETRHQEEQVIHRNYAIEHHKELKHSEPHLQFKFHTEGIGTFRINLEFKNTKEYEKAIKGFIYKIKEILETLESQKKGITKKILVLELVNKLYKEKEFLNQKITQSINQGLIEFNRELISERKEKLEQNTQLLKFIGKENIKQINQYKKFEKNNQ